MTTSSIFTVLALLTLLATVVPGQSRPNESSAYVNELPGYKFYERAKWKSLRPLLSTMADVRRVLGEPSEAHDVSQYTKPYPGDRLAKKPVLTYELDADWQIIVYFAKYCFYEGPALPASLDERLCSIDLVPKKQINFSSIEFPVAFRKNHITAKDAAWDEYSDGSGLVYEVYTTGTRYGGKQAGDLNRIKYGPSAEDIRKYASQ
jgi:hypothetical protein